jgi:hypothetical protein
MIYSNSLLVVVALLVVAVDKDNALLLQPQRSLHAIASPPQHTM